MPMFYTPSPRKFHYQPRFYDPEKEEWNKMKQKYGIDGKASIPTEQPTEASSDSENSQPSTQKETSAEIAYFEALDRKMMQREKAKASKLSWKDLFRKREMPTFNYQPRFSEGTTTQSAETSTYTPKKKHFTRRFDIEDTKYFEPISAGKIMLFALVAFLLLVWILF